MVVPTNSVEYKAAERAMEATFGKKPLPQRGGGSIPIVATLDQVLAAGSVLIVLIVELLNSGIEAAIDRISFEHHELSGRAKDDAGAAVLLSLALCGAVWLAAIWQRVTA